MEDGTKIRKRGCSPSSSTTSSVIQGYKLKRAIVVGKPKRGAAGGSSTPVPTWRMVGSRSPSFILREAAPSVASPRYPPSLTDRSRAGQGHGQPPVSARKLAATLWELNDVPCPTPRMPPEEDAFRDKRLGRRLKVNKSLNSSSLPPHLSDPSHSPASQKMERCGTDRHRRREKSMSRRTKVDNYDSRSNASFMEVETRSQCQTPSGSTVAGVKTGLKDVSNALTTSKELLKIISRVWSHDHQPSTSMSLISALHSELERARLQINQLIREQTSDKKEINSLLKRFSQEKAAWKSKEQQAVEAAVETIAGELEVERKLRKQFQSLNKKLGKELADEKATFGNLIKQLETDDGGNGRYNQEEEEEEEEDEEEEDYTDQGGASGESDLHSIDLSTQNEELLKGRKSFANQAARRSSIMRSVSNVLEWGSRRNFEIDEHVPRRSYGNDIPRYKSSKGSRLVTEGEFTSPFGQPWPSQDPCNGALHRETMLIRGSGMRDRVEEEEEVISEAYHNLRRSRR